MVVIINVDETEVDARTAIVGYRGQHVTVAQSAFEMEIVAAEMAIALAVEVAELDGR